MDNRKYVLDKLHHSNSWRETGLNISEVINAIEIGNTDTTTLDVSKYTEKIAELEQETERLNAKIDKLTETNKKLREGNKAKK